MILSGVELQLLFLERHRYSLGTKRILNIVITYIQTYNLPAKKSFPEVRNEKINFIFFIIAVIDMAIFGMLTEPTDITVESDFG